MLLVGRIIATHGLGGNVKVISFFERAMDIFCYPLWDWKEKVHNCQKVGFTNRPNTFLAKFDNITSLEKAKELCNLELFVKKNDLPELSKNEVYLENLVNMLVEDGVRYGKVEGVGSNGQKNILDICWTNGQQESLICTKDLIRLVDYKNNVLHINAPSYI